MSVFDLSPEAAIERVAYYTLKLLALDAIIARPTADEKDWCSPDHQREFRALYVAHLDLARAQIRTEAQRYGVALADPTSDDVNA